MGPCWILCIILFWHMSETLRSESRRVGSMFAQSMDALLFYWLKLQPQCIPNSDNAHRGHSMFLAESDNAIHSAFDITRDTLFWEWLVQKRPNHNLNGLYSQLIFTFVGWYPNPSLQLRKCSTVWNPSWSNWEQINSYIRDTEILWMLHSCDDVQRFSRIDPTPWQKKQKSRN